jgi:hypothetical protein
LASYTLAFALQLRKKHGKTSVSVGRNLSQGREKPQSGWGKTAVRVEKNLSQGREKTQSM